MGKCCIPGCRNSRERVPGLTFHQIPSNSPVRELWIEVLKKQGVDSFTEWTLVCGDHFSHEDYKMTARKNFLLSTAVPSVFDIPSRIRPKKRGRKPRRAVQSSVVDDIVDPCDVTENSIRYSTPEQTDSPVRRTGRQRKRKVFTDMIVYMPKTNSGSDEEVEDRVKHEDAMSAVVDDYELVEPRTQPKPAKQKELNVIVFPSSSNKIKEKFGSGSTQKYDIGPASTKSSFVAVTEGPVGNGQAKRRCCQIQNQRLLFYKNIIVKLRKRVLELEARLQEKEMEMSQVES